MTISMKTITIEEYRKVLDLMSGNSVLIYWDGINDEDYEIEILNNRFEINSYVLFHMLGFYLGTSIKSILPNGPKENSAIIKIPKLWYKNKELEKLLKERHIAYIASNYPTNTFGTNKIKFEELAPQEYFHHIEGNINDIMRKQYENMKILYFPHPMLTYFPKHPTFEKRCYDIIEREIGNKLPDSIKIENIINPNSEHYRWKKEGEEENVHESEWDSGFTWEKFGNSMTWYCRLVEKSDGIIWSPIFEYNTRKNAKMNFIRRIKRGVKTEISHATKLGIPIISFSHPDERMLPTDIYLPYYMLDEIEGKIIGNDIVPYRLYRHSSNDKYKDNTIIGNIKSNSIEQNGKTIAKIETVSTEIKYYSLRCDKCTWTEGETREERVVRLVSRPHENCGGKISYTEQTNEYTHRKLINDKGENVGYITDVYDPKDHKTVDYIRWTEYKGQLCQPYNREENITRYRSPYPFHMYIDSATREIHEKPEGHDCAGGRLDIFEPWSGMPMSKDQKDKLRKLGMKEEEIIKIHSLSDSRKIADEIIDKMKRDEKPISPDTTYYTHGINIDNVDNNNIKFNDEGYNDLGVITCNIDDITKTYLLQLRDTIEKYRPEFRIHLSKDGIVTIEATKSVSELQKDTLYKLGMSKNDIDNIKFYEQAKDIIDTTNKDNIPIRTGCKYNPYDIVYEDGKFKFYEGHYPTYCFTYHNKASFNDIAIRYNELKEMVKKGCEMYLLNEQLIIETTHKPICIVKCPKCGKNKIFDNVVPVAWTKNDISEDRIINEIINRPHNDPNGIVCDGKPTIELKTKKISF